MAKRFVTDQDCTLRPQQQLHPRRKLAVLLAGPVGEASVTVPSARLSLSVAVALDGASPGSQQRRRPSLRLAVTVTGRGACAF